VSGEIIERILAVVDARPVLLSEVRLLEALRGLDRSAAIEAAIDERLMDQEAARLPQAAVSPEEEAAASRSLAARLPPGFSVPESALRALARREVSILKYVEFRFRPQVRVSDEAVRAAYREDYGTSPVPPAFESVAAGLRDQLARREMDQRIESWVKELRSQAEIRHGVEPPVR
jgi:hypothetical protein